METSLYLAIQYQKGLQHHGIKGQKWGDQNGPPYPLGSGQKSSAEKKASGTGGSGDGKKTNAFLHPIKAHKEKREAKRIAKQEKIKAKAEAKKLEKEKNKAKNDVVNAGLDLAYSIEGVLDGSSKMYMQEFLEDLKYDTDDNGGEGVSYDNTYYYMTEILGSRVKPSGDVELPEINERMCKSLEYRIGLEDYRKTQVNLSEVTYIVTACDAARSDVEKGTVSVSDCNTVTNLAKRYKDEFATKTKEAYDKDNISKYDDYAKKNGYQSFEALRKDYDMFDDNFGFASYRWYE